MSRSAHTIEIERIVLTDLGMNSERAERIRTLVEAELGSLLGRGGMPESLASGGEVDHLAAAPMHIATAHNDRHLASGVAQQVFRALNATGPSEAGR